MEHEQHPPTGPTFDTLKAAEALQQAGFTGVQARAVTQTIVESQANLASKADIRELRTEMKAEFKAQRAENQRLLAAFEAHVATLRAEMASLQADTKADIKALRADNRRMEETLRAEIGALREIAYTLRKLILSVTMPLAAAGFLALVGFAVDYFFLSR